MEHDQASAMPPANNDLLQQPKPPTPLMPSLSTPQTLKFSLEKDLLLNTFMSVWNTLV